MTYAKMADILYQRYSDIVSKHEVEQEILLARARCGEGNPAMIFVVAKNAIIDEVRRRSIWRSRVAPIEDVTPPRDPVDFIRRLEKEEEWANFLHSLPYFVRKLAEIAEIEATRHSLRGYEVWGRKGMQFLRENIMDRYEDWRETSPGKPPRYRTARECMRHELAKYFRGYYGKRRGGAY